jgi:hypothetical protein
MRPTCVNGRWEADARLIAALPELLEVLLTVREALDDRSDVIDTPDGPAPNWAMSLLTRVDEALGKAGAR